MHRNVRALGVQHVRKSIEEAGGFNNSFALTVIENEDTTDYKYSCIDGNHRLTCLREVITNAQQLSPI